MSDRRLGICLTALVVAAALTGCGGGGTAGKAKANAGGTVGDAITIKNFMFDPTPLKVKTGQKVTVTNNDSATHTITATDKSFDSKNLTKGQTFAFTAGKAGSYTYICDIHQYMKGTIEVS